jgi:hypothetical protein
VLVNPDHVFIQLVNGCRKHIQINVNYV